VRLEYHAATPANPRGRTQVVNKLTLESCGASRQQAASDFSTHAVYSLVHRAERALAHARHRLQVLVEVQQQSLVDGLQQRVELPAAPHTSYSPLRASALP
jgi:hypothetical protein